MKPSVISCRLALFTGFVLLPLTGGAEAAVLYQQDFQVNDTVNWTLNGGASDEQADYYFDYSTVGIPTPAGGTGTRGMKLQANLTDGVFAGMSASPTALALPANYILTFNFWSNTVGATTSPGFPAGGNSSSNLSTFGVGTTGLAVQSPGTATHSVYFAANGDGGSTTADYRAYSSAAATSYASGSAVYQAPAGSNSSANAYYAGFGGVAPPAAQTALYPNQNGSVAAGATAFAWHTVEIKLESDFITWTMDGLSLARIDRSTVTLGGSNIFFGHSDINAASSTDTNDAALIFTLIDNIRVVEVPEPSALSLAGLLALGLLRRRRA